MFYFVRRIAVDVLPYYSSNRFSIRLKTKSTSTVIRVNQSINQRLEIYWLGLRLQNINTPAIQVVRASEEANDATLYRSEACKLYLWLKGMIGSLAVLVMDMKIVIH